MPQVYKYAQSAIARCGATRCGYTSPSLFIAINGTQVATARDVDANKALYSAGLSITEVLHETANTAAFTMKGLEPSEGSDVVITLGSINNLDRLYAGTILNRTHNYVGTPANWNAPINVIDYTWLLTRRRISGQWTNTSATDIGNAIAAQVPGVTSAIDAGLPVLDSFSVTDVDALSAFTQLSKRIGGYCDVDYHKRVKLFITDTTVQNPTDLTAGHLSLTEFSFLRDLSQTRTRMFSQGGGSSASAAIGLATDAINTFGLIRLTLFQCVPTTVGAGHTFTVTGNGTYPSISVAAFSGGTALPDQAAAGVANLVSTTPAGTVSPSVANALVIAACATNSAVAVSSIDSSFTLYAHADAVSGAFSSAIAYQIQTTPTTRSPIFSLAASPNSVALVQSFKPGTTFAPVAHTAKASTDTNGFTSAAIDTTGATVIFLALASDSVVTRPTITDSYGNVWLVAELGETILPVDTATWYIPAGGTVVCGPQRLTYTGVQAGGAGSLVGPGFAPASAPTLALAAGAGVTTGPHNYAVTEVTAAGETLPSPIAAITTGAIPVPSVAPLVGSPTTGGSVDVGDHSYVVTSVNAAGETTPSPISGTATIALIDPPSSQPTQTSDAFFPADGFGPGLFTWAVTFLTATGETSASPVSPTANLGQTIHSTTLGNIQIGPSGVTGRRIYRTVANGSQLKLVGTISDNSTTIFTDGVTDAALGANIPTVNTAVTNATVPLSAIPLGGGSVTSRKLYRTVAGGSVYKLLATIADNVTTTYSDTTADASLGATAPTSNTATANQVSLSAIILGGATVTSRKLYRTASGGTQLKLLATLADNTTTTYTDSTADASLGANAPASDTSGLTQPTGNVFARQTTLLSAGVGWASSTGGWAVIGNGQQVIRYTGISGNTLTGIPSDGVGAITATIAYNSTVTAAPCLTGIPASGPGSIQYPINKGDPVNLLVQVDDVAAQAALAALLGNGDDGVIEDSISDGTIGETEARARGVAQLALLSTAQVTITYKSRDTNTHAGRLITVNLGTPTTVTATFQIQHVTIDNFQPALMPTFTVQASSSRFSLEDLLRLARAA